MRPPLSAARANLTLAPLGLVLSASAAVLVARWLGPETYADYATLMALVAWLLLLGESGCNAGLGRYWGDAGRLNARYSLYRTLQYRRWALSLFIALPLSAWLGPRWAEASGLSVTLWQPLHFAMVGLLAAATLHGQLANTAMLASFRHRRALLTNQAMTVARAVGLILVAGTLGEPLMMIVALLLLAIVEAAMLHHAVKTEIRHENAPLPHSMANAAQQHGLVALFDKVATGLSGGPFLLLALAGSQSRGDLAMLAIGSDLLQKAVSIVGLPLSNLVLPMLNESRQDPERFRRQITRIGGLMVMLFATAAGVIMTAVPVGLPLLLSSAYDGVVFIAMIWLLPVFIEAGVRMVWGAALYTLDQYRWLIRYNMMYAVGSLLALYFVRDMRLGTLVASLALLRLVMSTVMLAHAARLGLLPQESRPWGIVLAVGGACVASLCLQLLFQLSSETVRLLAGLGSYVMIIVLALRWLPLIPVPAYEALLHISGSNKRFIEHIIRSPAHRHA